MTADDFRDAVLANPADDAPRLSFADWLDDRGDAPRAEFIRVQCDLATLDENDPRRPGLEDREHELLSAHEREWLDPQWTAWNEWEFRRGFVEMVAARGPDLPTAYTPRTAPRDLHFVQRDLSHLRGSRPGPARRDRPRGREVIPIFDTAERLDLSGWDALGPSADALLTHRNWPRLEAVDLSYRPGPTDPSRVLANADFLPRLRSLNVGGSGESVDPRSLAKLAGRAPLEELVVFDLGYSGDDFVDLVTAFGPTLKRLDISDSDLHVGDDRYSHLAGRLDRLDISATRVDGYDLRNLLSSTCCTALSGLCMSRCPGAANDPEPIADSPFWSNAREFRADACNLSGPVLGTFCRHRGSAGLRVLSLSNNAIAARDVISLCGAPWAAALSYLDLSDNPLGREACDVLASGGFRRLRTLHLVNNSSARQGTSEPLIDDDGATVLAASTRLSNLRTLTLSRTDVTERGVRTVIESENWSLSGLGIAGLSLREDFVPGLAASPRLKRLAWLDLSNNPALGGDALLPLAESGSLSPLCELNLEGIAVSPRVERAFGNRLGPRLSVDRSDGPESELFD